MMEANSRILILIFLLGNFVDANNVPMKMTAPLESHHANSGRCEDMRVSGSSLNLRDVELRRVDSDFTNSLHINCLSLEDNGIAYVSPSSFNLLPNLLYLNLARNNLSLFNSSKLERHPHLRNLVLDENLSDESIILEFVNTIPELTYLYLCNCSIEDIASLSFSPRLAYLNLSANNLGSSKLAFLNDDVPVTMTDLDLANNGIEHLNASSLSSVARLRLDGNKFERLCGKSYCNEVVLMLEDVTNPQLLSASRNVLTSVDSDSFDDTVNIVHLNLSHSKIDSIHKGTFEKLEEIKYLSLEDNILKTIPELCNLESLQYLYLAKNYLHAVNNDSFCQIENLTFMDLSGNRTEYVEVGALEKLTRLEVFKLSNSLLKTFPCSWLERLKALRSLYVDGNRLKSLNGLGLGGLNMFAKLERAFAQNDLINRLYTNSSFSEVRNRPNVTT